MQTSNLPSTFAITALDLIDRAEKAEYETAKEIVPNLVLSETPIITFLRRDDYDPEKAAKRLVLNWKYRKELFGERWLLPMVQTGRGALTVHDIDTFGRAGCNYTLLGPMNCFASRTGPN